METPQSLAIVVPTFRAGRSLWFGIGEAARWRHANTKLTQIVIIDDESPQCAFREGSARIGDVELTLLVNSSNLGQSPATWRGLGLVDADWALLLEDDLLDWPTAMNAVARRLGPNVDLVSVARPCSKPDAAGARPRLQPLVRGIFKWAGDGDLADPTSPIKALRTRAFPRTDLKSWQRSLHEGLVVLSRRTEEILDTPLAWDGRPSRYSAGRLLRVGVNLWPRLLYRALRHLTKGAAIS